MALGWEGEDEKMSSSVVVVHGGGNGCDGLLRRRK